MKATQPNKLGTYKSNTSPVSYLLGRLIERNVRFNPERPADVQFIFIELKQKHDHDKQGIHHEETKHGLVP